MKEQLYNPKIHTIAESYMRDKFYMQYSPQFTDITPNQAIQIADAFTSQEQYTDETLHAYGLFITELLFQWEYVLASGLKIEAWKGNGEPYKNSRELFYDVRDNNHMYFFLTEKGFGSSADSAHPLLQDSGESTDAGYALCYNDIFRIVHDYFGHCIYGFQFGLKGETNAWQSHLAMFVSKGARQALSNETQGQTSWFQAGKHLRRADGSLPVKGESDFIPLQERPFSEQRVQILPDRVFAGLAYI